MLRETLLKLRESFGVTAKENEFLTAYFQKFPRMKKLFGPGLRVNKVVSDVRGTEHASYGTHQGKFAITLAPKFWQEWDKDKSFAMYLFTHELGHAVADFIGMSKWIQVAKDKFGIDVWALQPSTMDMPFQVYNWEEAFGETFAVLATKDARGLELLKKHWPKWIDLVTWAGQSQGVL